ncbi:hypothetical protein ACKVMT_08265 [Halobacteriales archaeon Cl-PHB]
MNPLDRLHSRKQRVSPADVSPDREGGPVKDVPIETIFDILSNRRRRLVLYYIVNVPEHEAVLGTLATQVAAWENGIPVSAISSTQRKRTYNTLQQTHLPKLDKSGIVEYDRNRGTVSLLVSPRQLAVYLKTLPRIGSSWTLGLFLSGLLLWFMLAGNWIAVHVLGLYQPGQRRIIVGFALFLVGVGLIHVYRTFF